MLPTQSGKARKSGKERKKLLEEDAVTWSEVKRTLRKKRKRKNKIYLIQEGKWCGCVWREKKIERKRPAADEGKWEKDEGREGIGIYSKGIFVHPGGHGCFAYFQIANLNQNHH